MNKFIFLLKYIRYRFSAQTKHDIHSPFVFELLTKAINNKTTLTDYNSIEDLRKKLLNDKTLISIEDMGAGSLHSVSKTRSIADITYNSAKPKKYASLLYRLVQYLKPDNILELGTSLGISSAYMAKANPDALVITIEGSENIAHIAANNFRLLNIKNIRQITGNFDTRLAVLLQENKIYDFVFFDGNHRKQPTLNYFQQCLRHKNSQSIFIFDDIHWSSEMEEAWDEIKQSPEVTVSIDLFFIGLVFFRKESTKEHFVIRF